MNEKPLIIHFLARSEGNIKFIGKNATVPVLSVLLPSKNYNAQTVLLTQFKVVELFSTCMASTPWCLNTVIDLSKSISRGFAFSIICPTGALAAT